MTFLQITPRNTNGWTYAKVGTVSYSTSTPGLKTLTFVGAPPTQDGKAGYGWQFAGTPITDGSGTLGVTVRTWGITDFASASTYTGPTVISTGTAWADASDVASTSGPFGKPGATSATSTPIYLGDAYTSSSGSNASLLTNAGVTLIRPITVNDCATQGFYTIGGNSTSTSTLSGLITVNQPTIFSQAATGTLNITGGIVSGKAGVQQLLTFYSPGTINVTQPIADCNSGTVAVTVGIPNTVGLGTTTFSAANTYSGATTVGYTGTLKLDFTAAGAPLSNIINPLSSLVLNGGTLNVTGKNTATVNSQTFTNGTTINPGGSSIQLTTGASAPAADCIALGAITRKAGGTVDFSFPAPANGVIKTTTPNAIFPGGQQTILGGWATVGAGNANASITAIDWAVSGSGSTAGAITALPAAGYTAGLVPGTDALIAAQGTTNYAGNLTLNSLKVNAANGVSGAAGSGAYYGVNVVGDLTIATGGILSIATTYNYGWITANHLTSANGQDLIVATFSNQWSNSVTIDGIITDCGTASTGPCP